MKELSKTAKFQFRNYKILKSHFEIKNENHSNTINLNFEPKGIINRENSCFKLQLGVQIEDAEKSFLINVVIVADFYFDTDISPEHLNTYFYVNAPALLFPYVRAYISTLTTLSGINPINLPTLNLTALGGQLQQNTIESTECGDVTVKHLHD
ncbi:MAG: protein export chaperone secb [Bacteroidales bacterium]|jgi:preprotein translocase subunit SecB|nr:protein export chaperone secb [Bacteroidales bacterium]